MPFPLPLLLTCGSACQAPLPSSSSSYKGSKSRVLWLPITQTGWISFDLAGGKYIGYNDVKKKFSHSRDISETLRNHLQTNGATFITLGSDDAFFIKHINGGWNAISPPNELKNLNNLRPHVGTNFDRAIRGVLVEFGQGWCLEPGSTLCPYSDRYFFLKFKKPKENVIQMRWSLPDLMSQQLAELKEQTESPEDQAFIAQLRLANTQQQQNQNALAMQRLNFQQQMNDLTCQTLKNTGNSILRDYVEQSMPF
ncbi:hypothetical protein DFH09DRAFT_1279568 [Mycena vulgaris]|nr:hypothetical protein DFH09DRAFT_1279568 [Mycena vulgaris]